MRRQLGARLSWVVLVRLDFGCPMQEGVLPCPEIEVPVEWWVRSQPLAPALLPLCPALLLRPLRALV